MGVFNKIDKELRRVEDSVTGFIDHNPVVTAALFGPALTGTAYVSAKANQETRRGLRNMATPDQPKADSGKKSSLGNSGSNAKSLLRRASASRGTGATLLTGANALGSRGPVG